jgi:hypothetical protein
VGRIGLKADRFPFFKRTAKEDFRRTSRDVRDSSRSPRVSAKELSTKPEA